ncbi:hypothetical protein BD414DRAFT_474884 [Trametes punicea]|nr:hypothetical protein BD414DRAFT_474884 [Trametes punicea]
MLESATPAEGDVIDAADVETATACAEELAKKVNSFLSDGHEVMPHGMAGKGTSPNQEWVPLVPPASRYTYVIMDGPLAGTHFGQEAFHGADAWASLVLDSKKKRKALWGTTGEKPCRLQYRLGLPAGNEVMACTDARAMESWRDHQTALEMLQEGRRFKETTGSIVEQWAITRFFCNVVMEDNHPSTEDAQLDTDSEETLSDCVFGNAHAMPSHEQRTLSYDFNDGSLTYASYTKKYLRGVAARLCSRSTTMCC